MSNELTNDVNKKSSKTARAAVYAYLRERGQATAQELYEVVGIHRGFVKDLLYRGKLSGEFLVERMLNDKRKCVYRLGVPKEPKAQKSGWVRKSPKRNPSKPVSAKKPVAKVETIKQTKVWTPPKKPIPPEIIYPPNYKYTVVNSNYIVYDPARHA